MGGGVVGVEGSSGLLSILGQSVGLLSRGQARWGGAGYTAPSNQGNPHTETLRQSNLIKDLWDSFDHLCARSSQRRSEGVATGVTARGFCLLKWAKPALGPDHAARGRTKVGRAVFTHTLSVSFPLNAFVLLVNLA